MIWKEEAFLSWLDQWAIIYGSDSPSHKFLENIHNTFFLMNVVDNDFINGDLDKLFSDFIDQNKELIDSI
jgi:methylenetetrahydrofolate reductase (NADPH)